MFRIRLILLVAMVFISANMVYAEEVVISDDLKNDGIVDFLPLFKQQTMKAGAKPPKPFFIAPYFFLMGDQMLISNVKATGVGGIFGEGTPIPDGEIKMSGTKVRSNTFGVRAGVWILPFWSVYGMYGYTFGTTSFDVSSDNSGLSLILKDVDSTTKIAVNTGAIGTTVAYGMSDVLLGFDVFANMDLNYSWSKVNILDNTLNMIILSPRIGLSHKLPKKMSLAFWVGGMYKDDFNTNKRVIGRYNLGNGMYARYEADKRLISPWNMVAGINFQPCNWFSIVAEAGFLNRWSVNTNFQFHF